jgi:acetyltransferase-like isoleucine patch superfamily enzyme
MIRILKSLKGEFLNRYSRLQIYHYFVANIPGTFGQRIRSKLLLKYFYFAGDNIVIHPGLRFRGIHRLSCGNSVSIGVDSFLQASGGLQIGDNTILGPGVKIWTINHEINKCGLNINEQGYKYEKVTIGKDVWLGANVFVLPGVNIPDGCVISACSVVNKKQFLPYSIIAGHPCRIVGKRNH